MVVRKPRRGISAEFEKALKSGDLLPLLDRVQNDDTLSLEVRDGYVDIYYRGGRLQVECLKRAGLMDLATCTISAALAFPVFHRRGLDGRLPARDRREVREASRAIGA